MPFSDVRWLDAPQRSGSSTEVSWGSQMEMSAEELAAYLKLKRIFQAADRDREGRLKLSG